MGKQDQPATKESKADMPDAHYKAETPVSVLPDIPHVTNLQPGSKGRNFESFSGLLLEEESIKTEEEKLQAEILSDNTRIAGTIW